MKLPGSLIQAITLGIGVSSTVSGCNTKSEPVIINNSHNTSLILLEKKDSPAVDTLTLPMTAEDSLEWRVKQMNPTSTKGRKYRYCPTCGMG